jgi:hypothetical protein
MSLSDLSTSIFRLSPTGDAWRDFAPSCRERLDVATLAETAGVDTPMDFSEYWLSVAWRERVKIRTPTARA